MKEVAIVIVARNVGGLERRFAALYKYYAQRNTAYRLTFIVSRAQTTRMREKYIKAINPNLTLAEFGLNAQCSDRCGRFEFLLRMVDYSLLVALLLLRFRGKSFAAVHFVTPSSLFFRRFLRSRVKVISVVNSNAFGEVSSSKILSKVLVEGFYVDSLSSDLRSKVLAMGLSDEAKQHVAPCSFSDYEHTGIGEKHNWLLFVSRFVRRKGLDILLPALPEILWRCPELLIKMVGRGPLEDYIRDAVRDMPSNERIWIGFEVEPIKLLRHSVIFLSLQQFENYPSQSLLEAMACANAIVATDVGLTRQLIDGDVGILIDPDKNSLVEAVCHLYGNREEAIKMGMQARRRVMSNHTAEKFAAYLESIYFE